MADSTSCVQRTTDKSTLLASWFVTEFHWPTQEDHDAMDGVDTPRCHVCLRNKTFLLEHGAQMHEKVDGWAAAQWMKQQHGIQAHCVSLVVWGSPHMQLATGNFSQQGCGVRGEEKVNVFKSLCQQFPFAAVVVTYAHHDIKPTVDVEQDTVISDLLVNVPISPISGTQYVPRNSTGEKRCGSGDIRAIVRMPSRYSSQGASVWQAMSSRPAADGNGNESVLHLYRLTECFVPTAFQGDNGWEPEACIFLGEEACDLSRCVAEWHVQHAVDSAGSKAHASEQSNSPAARRRRQIVAS